MHYVIERIDDDDTGDPQLSALRPAARRVLTSLQKANEWLTVQAIGDLVAVDSTPAYRPSKHAPSKTHAKRSSRSD